MPERHNDLLLYHQSPHYAEVHKPKKRRYSCRNMGGLQSKTATPTKTDVSEEEMSQILEKSFQTVNMPYLTEVNQAKLTKREVNQLNV